MLVFFALILGCAPTCEQTCKKLLSCENIDAPNMNMDECSTACSAQQNLYQEWEDSDKEQSFDDLKSCIVSEECEDVEAGVCYDSDMYIW